MPIRSLVFGLIGRADVVEFHLQVGQVEEVVVEVKITQVEM